MEISYTKKALTILESLQIQAEQQNPYGGSRKIHDEKLREELIKNSPLRRDKTGKYNFLDPNLEVESIIDLFKSYENKLPTIYEDPIDYPKLLIMWEKVVESAKKLGYQLPASVSIGTICSGGINAHVVPINEKNKEYLIVFNRQIFMLCDLLSRYISFIIDNEVKKYSANQTLKIRKPTKEEISQLNEIIYYLLNRIKFYRDENGSIKMISAIDILNNKLPIIELNNTAHHFKEILTPSMLFFVIAHELSHIIINIEKEENNEGLKSKFEEELFCDLYGCQIAAQTANDIFHKTIPNGWQKFGLSVSCAGDVNKDWYSDVIVGEIGRGRAYVFYGGAVMDSIPDIIKTGIKFGVSVASAGDVNGDGSPDLIIGADWYSSGIGRAFIYINLSPKPELINPVNSSTYNSTTVSFKWKKINASDYYILNVSTDSAFNNIVVNDTIMTDTTKVIGSFLKNTKYFWKVLAKDTSNMIYNSSIWNFTTIPPIYLKVNLLFEGMYFPAFNQLMRKDSATAYLRQSNPPFNIIDSAKSIIDSNTFIGSFNFYNAETGTYYISINHLNTIETWSKAGGENLVTDGVIYNYDFTTSFSQAYGNNLKLKGSKYCLYSGDVNQDGYITLFDVIPIYNDATSFVTGRFINTDLTGDNIVDLTDVSLCYNNSTNFIRVRQP